LKEFTVCGAFAALSAMTMSPWLVWSVIVYFFAGSMVIGGSVDQLFDVPDGAEADVEAASEGEVEDESEGESEAEVGAAVVLPEDTEEPASGPIVPLEAQPDSSSPLTAARMPMPIP
jgi:hypothetical protein